MAKHNELTDADLHVPGYVQAGDPGAVGAGVGWIDTSGGAGNWLWKIRNATDNGWEILVSAGGVTDFVDLTDTPVDYGTDGQVLTTNGVDTTSWGDVPEPAGIPNYELIDEQLDIVCFHAIGTALTATRESISAFVMDETPDGITLLFDTAWGFNNFLFTNIEVGSLAITATVGGSPVVITDPAGDGNLVGSNVTGTVSYVDGGWALTFTGTPPDDTTDITADFVTYTSTTLGTRLTAYDCIRAIHGGTGPFTYGIEFEDTPGYVAQANARDAYIVADCDRLGQVLVFVYVLDAYSNVYGPVHVSWLIQDHWGLCPMLP